MRHDIGWALANALLGCTTIASDYFVVPNHPSYKMERPVEEGLRLMREVFLPGADRVLSGSRNDW
jgi:hypothetical protein